MNSKPFWESKIMWASLINFIFSLTFVFTGFALPEATQELIPDAILTAIDQKTTWAILSAVTSIVIMVSRAIYKAGERINDYWTSAIFWGAIVSTIFNFLAWQTSVEVPVDLQAQLVETITQIFTTGDVLTGIGGLISIAITIFRLYRTDKTVTLKPVSVRDLKRAA